MPEVFLDGKIFLSLKKAGEVSGYHSDYLGRLARSGKLKSRKVGIQWFIEKESLLNFFERTEAKVPESPDEGRAEKSKEETVPVEVKKVEPSIFIQNLELKLAAERKAVQTLRSPQARRVIFENLKKQDSWETSLLGDRFQIGTLQYEIYKPPDIVKPRINFFSRHLLIPALAAVLIFSFGLFGDSLASFGKNLGNTFSSLARHSFSEGGIVSGTLSLLSSRAPSQNLSGSVFSSISSFFSQASNQIALWFSSLQDALLTLLGYPSEEEIAAGPKRNEGLPSTPPLAAATTLLPSSGCKSCKEPSASEELAKLQSELARAKFQGLDVSPAPPPRIIERVIERSIAGLSSQEVDQRLSSLNQALLGEISSLKKELVDKTQANFNAIALTQRINNLGAVTITSPTISTAAITSSTFSGTNVTADGGTFGSLTVTGDQTISGNQTIGNLLTVSSLNATSTATSTITKLLVTNVPSLPHIFSTWATGVASSSVLNASFVINPSSATADTNLLGIAVNGSPKALIDAEGDLFIRNLVAEGSVTQGATTLASLSVEGNSTFGDAIGDTITYNTGTLTFNNRATTTIPNLTVNAYSIATSTSIVPTFTISTASSPFGLVGIGTTSPTESLSTAGRLYIGGTGTSTIENNLIVRGTLQTGSGSIFLGSNFLNFNTSASTSLPTALNAWNIANSLLSLDTSNFRVGIGTSTPSNSFSLQGNAYISGSLANVSNITATGTIQTTGSATSTWSSAGLSVAGGGLASSAGLTITAGGLTCTTCIPNTSLANSSVSYGGVSVSLGGSDATPAFDLTDATSLPIVGGTTGTLTVARGGTGTTTAVSGGIFFHDGTTFVQDSANLFWDDSNNRLGIGTTSPAESLSTAGRLYVGGTGTSTIENNLKVLGTLQTGSGSIFLGSNFLNFNQASTLNFQSSATTTIPNSLINSFSFATSSTVAPLLSLDTLNTRVGLFTSAPTQRFQINDAATAAFVVTSAGQVGIGTT
ncbi:MAG: hypothetical protein Q8R12_03230, partial [bacterium]|nr:hypothetical protein [bacterium]